MKYTKGQSGNPKGKPKGAMNKTTLDLRKAINDFLTGNFDEVVKLWSKLGNKERINFYRDLLRYAVPTISAIQMDLKDTTEEKQITEINIVHTYPDPFKQIRENAGIKEN
jgi:hypothetical protein